MEAETSENNASSSWLTGKGLIQLTYLVLFNEVIWQYSTAAIADLPIEVLKGLDLLAVLRFFKLDCFCAMMFSLTSLPLHFVQKQKYKYKYK